MLLDGLYIIFGDISVLSCRFLNWIVNFLTVEFKSSYFGY